MPLWERRVAQVGMDSGITHTGMKGSGPGYFGADVSMQPLGGPPSCNTSCDRPNLNSLEKDQTEGVRRRETKRSRLGGSEKETVKRIATQQDAAKVKPTRRWCTREVEKNTGNREVDAKRRVRYDRTRNLLIRP